MGEGQCSIQEYRHIRTMYRHIRFAPSVKPNTHSYLTLTTLPSRPRPPQLSDTLNPSSRSPWLRVPSSHVLPLLIVPSITGNVGASLLVPYGLLAPESELLNVLAKWKSIKYLNICVNIYIYLYTYISI